MRCCRADAHTYRHADALTRARTPWHSRERGGLHPLAELEQRVLRDALVAVEVRNGQLSERGDVVLVPRGRLKPLGQVPLQRRVSSQ